MSHRAAVIVMAMLLVANVRQVAAQQAAESTTRGAPESTTRGAPAVIDDGPLFRCNRQVGEIVTTLKAEVDVKELVTWVMGFTCKDFLFDPRVVATGRKVSLITPKPMSPRDAYEVFLAALATVNLTVVPHGNRLRIVEAATARRQAVPLMTRGTPGDIEQVVRYVYRPSHVSVESLVLACQALKSDAGDVVALGRVLLITDYANHVRDMLSFAKLVDVPGGSDGIYTLPVRHADAAKLTEKLNAILNVSSGGAGRPRSAGTEPRESEPGKETAAVPSKIVVDERTNTLVIASGEAGYQRVKALVERLDIALEIDGGSSIHVYPLGSAIADELAKTLTAAIGDGRAARPAGTPPSPSPSSSLAPPASSVPAPPTPAPGPAIPALGAALDGQVRVIADTPTNSLIVMASGRDFLAIKDVIKQLDLPRREVYIEALILEIEAGGDTTLGTVSHGGLPRGDQGAVVFGGVKTLDANSTGIFDSLADMTGLFGGVVGKSMTLLGKSIPSYAVLFQAVAEHSNANIISSPSIIAVDNVEAKYKVGTKIPVDKGPVLTPFGGSTVSQSARELVEFPLKLDIKPHISSDDMVLLEVKHEADQLTVVTERGPESSTRSFDTRVVVRDQETVVLSGLTQDREFSQTVKVPLLGDIPLLGYLFKTTRRSRRRTNLLVLLTPYIIKDRRDLQAIRARKLREHDEFTQSMWTLDRLRYDAKIDYGKKRGLIEEINRAVLEVEQDVAAREALPRPKQVEAGSVDASPSEPSEP